MSIHSSKPGQQLTGFNAFLLMVAVFAASMGTGVFSFTLPLMNLDEKAGGMWLGSGFAGYFLAKLLIAPMSGYYADRNGIRTPLLSSCLVAAALPIPYLLFPAIETLYTIQFFLGLCAGTIRTVSMAAIGTNMRGKSLSSNFAHLSAVMNSSFLLGPLLGGLLYIDKDYLPVLWAMSGFMGTAFLLFILSARHYQPLPHANEETPPVRAEASSYMNIMLALFGRAMGIGSMIAFYPVLLKSVLQLSPGMTAMLFSLPSLITVLLLPLSGRILAGFERRLTTCCGMFTSGAALYLAAGCNTVQGFILVGVISGIGAAVSMPASMSICAELGSRKGRTLGVANMAANLGFMAGPLFCGLLVTVTGHIAAPFRLTAIVGILSCLPLLYEVARVKRLKKASLAAIILTAAALFAAIPAQLVPPTVNEGDNLFRYSDVAMGTVVNLTIAGQADQGTEKMAREAVSTMHQLQKDLDHRNRRGSVGRINHDAGGKSVKVSDKAFETIMRGLEISEKSGGSFDITIGAITTTPFYYALDPERFTGHKKLIDHRLVEFDKEGKRVRLPLKGMALDLGGLAKGTIIDAAAQHLKQSGIRTAMVEAGGDFMVFGDRTWAIGIRNPRGEGIIGLIDVKNSAVCGSGDYYQFITSVTLNDNTRKHHIFDPALLRSSVGCIATTTVAPNAETADALATTVFIMGPDKGQKFMHDFFPDSSAMWIMPDLSIRTTPNFPEIKHPDTTESTEQ
ncbi:MFS transporter [Maridesulfovibrio sp. FT414]|uniref:MFS transporter n=1 Tax=Maridesulfovibrio sp. FT414 TaxID=2979469 RepID=UPI003D805F38